MSSNNIGLHVRFKENFLDIVQQAQTYNINTVQFFLTPAIKHNMRYVSITEKIKEKFLHFKKEFSPNVYIHTSYWINPATGDSLNFQRTIQNLEREIKLAKLLDIRSLVLHPGSATHYDPTDDDPLCKKQGIKTISKILSHILQNTDNIEILLENTAHANHSIGSDLEDFILLKKELSHLKNVNFCLDIGHAFAYGYNISNIDQFVDTLDKTMGLDRIKLIHLNDTDEFCGSKKDSHVLPGTGQIGIKNLQKYCEHEFFKTKPKILELPSESAQTIQLILNKFTNK
ncbi:MAG: deoxyribonuclease IV [bacterium]